jgi:hypothetical protein
MSSLLEQTGFDDEFEESDDLSGDKNNLYNNLRL